MIFADLHIHSKYSRATSKNLSLENLEKWARVKGIDILGTGDFTHPKWLAEIKASLEDKEKKGIFYSKSGFRFILTGEISLIYTQIRGRRIHLVLLAPNLEAVDKINAYLDTKGRRDYDGRPIFKISCEEFTRKMKEISEDIEVIPAHCLLPDSLIHSKEGLKKIKDISIGDKVMTHRGEFKKVKEVLVHNHKGLLFNIIPWYFREGLKTTPEHPFFAIKSYKNCPSTKGTCKPLCSQVGKGCSKKYYKNYNPEWIFAKDLEKGDFLVYPKPKDCKDIDEINILDYVSNYQILNNNYILSKNARNHTGKIIKRIKVDKRFCRLVGYFLSEGYLIKDSAVGFSFHSQEQSYINEVCSIIKDYFGFDVSSIDSRRKNQNDLIFHSKLLNEFFANFYSEGKKNAANKKILNDFINLPKPKLAEILRGWWRGDTGYTVSRQLAGQIKLICLKLGIIPSINIDSIESYEKRGKHFINGRKINAKNDLIIFSNLSFFEEDYGMLKENCFKRSINKINRKHGWIDKNYAYLPIRQIKKEVYNGDVFNLEVEEDNSYVSEFACVHNCWTPWFGVFGSESGFDSLKEAFGSQYNNIHAIETGMSSDPEMNWHIKELNDKSIVSFSDCHSFWPWRLGREATIFNKAESYKDLIQEIRENKIYGTIETDPGYGKYHFDGHRLCKFSCSPQESKKLNNICPVCKRPLVIGVENRVEKLTSQKPEENPHQKPFFKLLPVHEIISMVFETSMSSKKAWGIYNDMIAKFKNEFNILLNVKKEDFEKEKIDSKLTEQILLNRQGKIKVIPGYDGEYGKAVMDGKVVSLEEDSEAAKPAEIKVSSNNQKTLF